MSDQAMEGIDSINREMNALKLQIGLMTQQVSEMSKRIDDLAGNLKHGQRNAETVNIAVEKMIGKMEAQEERIEKLESNQTWFIRGITGIVITALSVLLFKGGVKPL